VIKYAAAEFSNSSNQWEASTGNIVAVPPNIILLPILYEDNIPKVFFYIFLGPKKENFNSVPRYKCLKNGLNTKERESLRKCPLKKA
jgi:hypothetical protein